MTELKANFNKEIGVFRKSYIQLIVGLQNPGAQYKHTRHNAGRWFLQAILDQKNLSFKIEKKFQGELATFTHDDTTCILFAPMCFMNLSGIAIQQLIQYYKINIKNMLVIHDDLDLPVGCIKLKNSGGHGGHNGLKSIISHLGTADFYRLRIGIGHPGNKEAVHNYVLSAPSQIDQELINKAIMQGLDILPYLLNGEYSKAMQILHT